MTITGLRISPTTIAGAVAAGSVADAEAKLKNVEDTLHRASAEWVAFTSSADVKAINAGRTLSSDQTASLITGLFKLIRGTATVISAEHAALVSVVQALKSVNAKP